MNYEKDKYLKIIVLVKKYQKESVSEEKNFIFECIIEELNYLLKYYQKKIKAIYQDDLKQELLVTILKVINEFNIQQKIKFDQSLFNQKNFDILNKYHFQNINTVFNNNYLKDFTDKYGIKLVKKAFSNKKYYQKFIDIFNLFCIRNQFISYVKKALNNSYQNFNKSIKRNRMFKMNSLNIVIFENVEIIDLIIDKSEANLDISIFDDYLSKDEKAFINLFIFEGRVLTQKEVAEIIGITQQAVSKKFNKIKRKILKKN